MSNFSDRINKVFSFLAISKDSKLIFNIFKNEILRLIPILNKEYNINLNKNEIYIEEIVLKTEDEDLDSLNYFSAFGTSKVPGYNYALAVHPYALEYQWNNKSSRYSKIYKSLELFIKDCACHELFHLYNYIITGKVDNHDGWFIDHYAPDYSKRVLKNNVNNLHDYRSDYTDSDPIFREYFKDGDKIVDMLFSYTTDKAIYFNHFTQNKYLNHFIHRRLNS